MVRKTRMRSKRKTARGLRRKRMRSKRKTTHGLRRGRKLSRKRTRSKRKTVKHGGALATIKQWQANREAERLKSQESEKRLANLVKKEAEAKAAQLADTKAKVRQTSMKEEESTQGFKWPTEADEGLQLTRQLAMLIRQDKEREAAAVLDDATVAASTIKWSLAASRR